MSVRYLVSLFALTTASAQDRGPVAKDAEAVPISIETVASGGYWSRDHHDGTYRLVIEVLGWDTLHNRAFLQSLAADQEKQQTVIERTIPIEEIGSSWRIFSPTFQRRDKQTVIVISAERVAPPGKAIVTITPASDYTYKITVSEK